jgi:hypothetical protein
MKTKARVPAIKTPPAPRCALCLVAPLDPARPVGRGVCDPCLERSRAFVADVLRYGADLVAPLAARFPGPEAAQAVQAAREGIQDMEAAYALRVRLRTLAEDREGHDRAARAIARAALELLRLATDPGWYWLQRDAAEVQALADRAAGLSL